MANYKRKKPKQHRIINCCWEESFFCTGNHKYRKTKRDMRQPQFYGDSEIHNRHPYRYGGIKWF